MPAPTVPASDELLILDAQTCARLLSWPDAIAVMDQAMRALSAGTATQPPRLFMATGDAGMMLCVMPGAIESPALAGAKLLSLVADNPRHGRPAIQGFVLLFDQQTGTPLALLAGTAVTTLRTAAASALATRELARPDATSHGVLGTGVQALAHIAAIAAVRPLREVLVWGRNPAKARALAAQAARQTGLAVRACTDPAEAAAADIVSTTTASPEPVLHGEWLTPGAHVNLVGAHTPATREADSNVVTCAGLYADSARSLFAEAGDVLIPLGEGRFRRDHLRGEIGQVLEGTVPGRRDEREVTLYKSLGVTAQDLYAAARIYAVARASDAGVVVRL